MMQIALIEKYKLDVNAPDSDSRRLLNVDVATQDNMISLVKYLLRKGANPDIKDGTGLTASEWAKTPGSSPKMLQIFQDYYKKKVEEPMSSLRPC